MDQVAIENPNSFFHRPRSPTNRNPVIPDLSGIVMHNHNTFGRMNTNMNRDSYPALQHGSNGFPAGHTSVNVPTNAGPIMLDLSKIPAYPSFATDNFPFPPGPMYAWARNLNIGGRPNQHPQRPYTNPNGGPMDDVPQPSVLNPFKTNVEWGPYSNSQQGSGYPRDAVDYTRYDHPPPPTMSGRPTNDSESVLHQTQYRGSGPALREFSPVHQREDGSNLFVHSDFAIWPEKFEPYIEWDMSQPEKITREGKPLTPEELNSSIFKPSQSLMVIAFEKAPNVTCTVKSLSGPGSEITLQHLINSIARILHCRVTYEFWRCSPLEKRQEIVRAWGRRHPGEPAPWGLNRFGVMDAWEVEPGMTGFEYMDVLGPDVIFFGISLNKNGKGWTIKTISKY